MDSKHIASGQASYASTESSNALTTRIVTVISLTQAVSNADTTAQAPPLQIRTTVIDERFHQQAFYSDTHFTEQIYRDPEFALVAQIYANCSPSDRFLSAGIAITCVGDAELYAPGMLSASETPAVMVATAICNEFPRSGLPHCWTCDPAILDRGRRFMQNARASCNERINLALVSEALGFGLNIQNNLFGVTDFKILCQLISSHQRVIENENTSAEEALALDRYIAELKTSHAGTS